MKAILHSAILQEKTTNIQSILPDAWMYITKSGQKARKSLNQFQVLHQRLLRSHRPTWSRCASQCIDCREKGGNLSITTTIISFSSSEIRLSRERKMKTLFCQHEKNCIHLRKNALEEKQSSSEEKLPKAQWVNWHFLDFVVENGFPASSHVIPKNWISLKTGDLLLERVVPIVLLSLLGGSV